MNTVFITGSSGVGKTPLVGILKSILSDNFDVHDIDEKLVEADRSKLDWLQEWRKNATKFFLGLAIENAKKNKSTVVCGIIWPHEVLTFSDIRLVPPIKFIYLDVDSRELKKRFFARRWSDESKIADLKKDTGMTPDEYMKKNSIEVSQLKKESIQNSAKIIDTTNLNSEMVAKEIRKFLLN